MRSLGYEFERRRQRAVSGGNANDADVASEHIDRIGLIEQYHRIGGDGVAGEFNDLHRIAMGPYGCNG